MAEESQEEFLKCISQSTIQEIYAYLMRKKPSNIMHICDKDGYTVLHTLAHHNKPQIVEFIMRYCKDCYSTLFFKEKDDWVNKKTYDEELTCVHIAIMRGNLVLSK
jgi:hypothetical protein